MGKTIITKGFYIPVWWYAWQVKNGMIEMISDLDGIYVMLIINIISIIIFVASLKKLINLSAKI